MNEKLTEEQCKLVVENHNLIFLILNRKNLPIWECDNSLKEDWYGTAAIGLCKAARTFDEKRGYTFSTYAYRCILNEVNRRFSYVERQKVIPAGAIREFDLDEENEENCSYLKYLASNCDVERDVVAKQICEEYLSVLNPKEADIVRLLSMGMNQREAADRVGLSQRYISACVKRIREKIAKKEMSDGLYRRC